MESAKETIKACLIINAGSAAALIAFMGHLVTEKQYSLVELLAPSNKWFIAGAIAAIFGHGFSYLSNLFAVWWPPRWGENALYVAVALTLCSVICFAIGAYTASTSLSSISKTRQKQPTIQCTK
jgi:hypothetical protein